MRKKLVVLFLGALLPTQAGLATDHLVTSDTVRARLAAAAAGRAANVATVERALSAPGVESVAARMGVDAGRLRSAVGSLSDAELQDLAERAAALQVDPAAGLSRHRVDQIIIIIVLIAIVVYVALHLPRCC